MLHRHFQDKRFIQCLCGDPCGILAPALGIAHSQQVGIGGKPLYDVAMPADKTQAEKQMPAASRRCCPWRLMPGAPARTQTDREPSAVPPSPQSIRAPRVAERGNRFTNASTRSVICFSDSLPAGERLPPPHAARPRILQACSQGPVPRPKKLGGDLLAEKCRKTEAEARSVCPGRHIVRRHSILRRGSGRSESRSQPAADPLPPLAVKAERPKNRRTRGKSLQTCHTEEWTESKNSVAERSDDFMKIKSDNLELELDRQSRKGIRIVTGYRDDDRVDDGFANVLHH